MFLKPYIIVNSSNEMVHVNLFQIKTRIDVKEKEKEA